MTDEIRTTAGKVPFSAFISGLTTAMNALAGFLTLPFLIYELGAETYGLWVLIVAVTGYLLIFESGFTGAVGRIIAGKRLAGDIDGVNQVVFTALILTLPFSAAIALASSLIALPFLWAFEVPAAQASDVRLALLLIGVSIAFSLPEAVFYALLWGYQRFDLQSLVNIAIILLRTTMIFSLIDHSSTLLDMSIIAVTATTIGFGTRVYFSWVAEARLSLGPRRWSPKLVPDLLVLGGWFALLRASRSRLQDVASLVIGYLLGTAAVADFTVPRTLITYSGQLVQSVTQVVAPRAAAYYFAQQDYEQRHLFLTAGGYSMAISLYIFGAFLAVGQPFLSIWQHSSQIQQYQLLLILAAGEILPLSQWATYNAIVGMAKHRRLAVFGVGEVVSIVVFACIGGVQFGLMGVACAVAASAFVFRGLLQCLYGCELLNISLQQYARTAVLPILAPAIGAILALLMLSGFLDVRTWVELFAALVIYTLIYWAAILFTLLGWRNCTAFSNDNR